MIQVHKRMPTSCKRSSPCKASPHPSLNSSIQLDPLNSTQFLARLTRQPSMCTCMVSWAQQIQHTHISAPYGLASHVLSTKDQLLGPQGLTPLTDRQACIIIERVAKPVGPSDQTWLRSPVHPLLNSSTQRNSIQLDQAYTPNERRTYSTPVPDTARHTQITTKPAVMPLVAVT